MKDDTLEILKNSSRSKLSVDQDISLDIDLTSDEKLISLDNISSKIDQYRQYIKEKDASNKYRFVFTINPVCSNVLYNHVTEIIDNSGKTLSTAGIAVSSVNNPYLSYKYKNTTSKNLTREKLIQDTGYSHPKCGNFTYRPGIDIFNNHRFRGMETVLVNKLNTPSENFNTIFDAQRDYDGSTIIIPTSINLQETSGHIYYRDTTRNFIESIQDNLEEKDGWLGFTNPTSLEIPNFGNNAINKVINNRGACEFIDLYPDRTLFSFIPNKNSKYKRIEKNWDYCITYPYSNYYDNKLVSLIINDKIVLNGMLSDFCDSSGNKLMDIRGGEVNINAIDTLIGDGSEGRDEFENIVIRTRYKNNIKDSDYVRLHIVAENDSNVTKYYTIQKSLKVRSLGIGGYGLAYYFSLSRTDLLGALKTIKKRCGNDSTKVNNIRCYVQRISNSRPCKYYFRKFRRLPNFKIKGINNINGVTEADIDNCCFDEFNSSINKLGFGTNIYGDRLAQIVYSDDIDTTGLFDNLGRRLHEVFLTIIKTNNGHEKWYKDSGQDTTVEGSHCFGYVTSGIEIPWNNDVSNTDDDYNVHKIHNITKSGIKPEVQEPVKALPNGKTNSKTGINYWINCSGETYLEKTKVKYNGMFLGDIVELDELNVQENILETVCHRFNTAQREYTGDLFSAITYDEIVSDDYDGDGFKCVTRSFLGDDYHANIAPEGYYYKAHYRIPIKEFSDIVNEGQHTIVKFDSLNFCSLEDDYGYMIESGVTDKNYYFQIGDTILIYNKKTGEKYTETILDVFGDDFRNIKFTVHDDFVMRKDDFNFFKPNKLKPATAYDFDDGSGVYRWRDFESCEFISNDSELYDTVFTNGAHYIHKYINFFLKRQDPIGEFGLNLAANEDMPYQVRFMEQLGKEKDITQAQMFTNGDIQLC